MQIRKTMLLPLSILVLLCMPVLRDSNSVSLAGQYHNVTIIGTETHLPNLRSAKTIKQAQQILSDQGYYHGLINGRLTNNTRKALMNFQYDHQLSQTGYLNTVTAQLMGLGVIIVNRPLPVTEVNTLSSTTISYAQVDLRDMGYYQGPINGVLTAETRAAIRAFQSDNNLYATGNLDISTADQLNMGIVTVANRERYAVVYNFDSPVVLINAQQALKELGYYTGPIDGIYTDKTRHAIKLFQKLNDLPESGYLDVVTARMLGLGLVNRGY